MCVRGGVAWFIMIVSHKTLQEWIDVLPKAVGTVGWETFAFFSISV